MTTLYSGTQVQNNTAQAAVTKSDITVTAPVADNNDTNQNQSTSSVETNVRSYFADTPALVAIAKCESGFTQTGKNGNVIRGEVNPDDVGVMQINEHFHGESAERLGYDIYSLEGNMAFAKHLYKAYGTEPWLSSSKCWKPILRKTASN